MTTVKQFVFNPYQVNSYVISDETKECIIVDGACSGQKEFEQLDSYIKSEGLKPMQKFMPKLSALKWKRLNKLTNI